MNPDNLYCVESEGEGGNPDVSYVLAPSVREALAKYKERVVGFINEDYKSDGVDRVATVDEVEEPLSIYFLASSYQLLF